MTITIDAQKLNDINNLRGKYIKQTLMRLEDIHALSPEIRKIVLDGYNDLYREFHKIVGYTEEDATI